MSVLILSTLVSEQDWFNEIKRQKPDLDLRLSLDDGNINDITHAVVSSPEHGQLAKLPNLKYIHSMWAGIDHITKDPDWPKNIPIIRMIDYGLNHGIMEYVVGHVMHHHLRMDYFNDEQSKKLWSWQSQLLAKDRSIGILGLGTLGQFTAQHLSSLGFKLSGWSRTAKKIANVVSFAGNEELEAFLKQCDILICLLPNTTDTVNLLNDKRLKMLPKNSYIINAGRGQLINDDDLITNINNGHIFGATLDVFHQEPLPSNHPYWAHGKITVTPHIAAETKIDSGVKTILDNIKYLDDDNSINDLPGVFNIKSGY